MDCSKRHLDVQTGRKPHLSSGRWNTNEDRALFIAGYQQGYRETLEGHPGNLPRPAPADLAGYRDGMMDGAADHATSRSFEPERTANYLKGGQNFLREPDDPAEFEREYRHGYLNGYQQSYYSDERSAVVGYYPADKEVEPRSASGVPCNSGLSPGSK